MTVAVPVLVLIVLHPVAPVAQQAAMPHRPMAATSLQRPSGADANKPTVKRVRKVAAPAAAADGKGE